MTNRTTRIFKAFVAGIIFLSACTSGVSQSSPVPSPPASATGEGRKLAVVATTSIVSDVVAQVGGDRIELFTLLPLDADPHSFEPTPQDIARVSDADLVFINGAGLEEFLEDLIESAGEGVNVVAVSQGIETLEAPQESETGTQEEGHDVHAPDRADPHTWTDPNNVISWVNNIERALMDADPAHAAAYQTNAQAYRAQLEGLDAWIRNRVAEIPPQNREIVTDHTFLTYFTEAYGFEQIGAVIPAYSTLAEPSAQELAAIEDTIRSLGVKAIFVGRTVNPNLSERVAEDTGAQLVFIYTGSLSAPNGEAGTYLDYMRYNVNAIVDALR